jgi:hypothetical protein
VLDTPTRALDAHELSAGDVASTVCGTDFAGVARTRRWKGSLSSASIGAARSPTAGDVPTGDGGALDSCTGTIDRDLKDEDDDEDDEELDARFDA